MKRRALIVLLLVGTVGGFGMGFASKKAHYGKDGGWCHHAKTESGDAVKDAPGEAPPATSE